MDNQTSKSREQGAARKTEERASANERLGGLSSKGQSDSLFYIVLITSVTVQGQGCRCDVQILSAGNGTGMTIEGALCPKGIYQSGDQAMLYDGPEGPLLISGTGDFTSNVTNNTTNLNVAIYMGWGEAGS